jgi:hypothetical protein
MKQFFNRNGLANRLTRALALIALIPVMFSCAQADVPGARNVNIPSPTMADERPEAVNEKPDSVLYLPLGSDVLVPEATAGNPLPDDEVGPFELRSETLAGALQLILADYEIPMAFETNEGMTRTITVANLRGPMNKVVERVCSLANLYCAFEDGVLVIKDTQTFTVSIPPIGGQTDILPQLATGLGAIIGTTPITDSATRTLIYEATNRTAKLAESYFQRIRASTALIIYEMYIWEVTLNAANSTGIDWRSVAEFGKYSYGFDISGETTLTDVTPVTIGLPTTGNVVFGANNVFQFISQYGAVKTVSQPQLTVLSGSQASLRAADTQNYVSSLTRSVDQGEVSVSTETDSVDTGFTLTISSGWDNATVYGTVAINLEEFKRFQNFDADGTTLRLPETTQRELATQIRIRPGDSLLIAGLVRENDQYDTTGPGFKSPLIPASRGAQNSNTELVFLLKPRVIVYTSETAESRAAEAAGMAPSPKAKETLFPTGTLSPDMLNPAIE